MTAKLTTLIGFVGVALVLAAYFANQQRWLPSENWRVPAITILGSCLILVSLYAEWNFPSFVINSAWVAISLWGLAKGMRVRASR
jgi:hypothetical protein